jgi:acetyltransferase-like isoleucine patch superfamily enzyme
MLEGFVVKIKRAETPFYARLKRLAQAFLSASLPYPGFLRPILRLVYATHLTVRRGFQWFIVFFYKSPLFRARCESVGRNFRLSRLPDMQGPVKIWIGDNVNFFGQVDIYSGSILDEPKLILGNRVDLGHGVGFVVNREIVIEDDVNVASGVCFMDSDAHPRDTTDRIADRPPKPEEIRAVRVCRFAWIGQRSYILKGVTIGEGAIVGVNSVVVTDVPPYAVVMGNPARVVLKNASPPVQSTR